MEDAADGRFLDVILFPLFLFLFPVDMPAML
jgi:hypothetical protein